MSVSRFKFVSPGISLKEIDKSKTPTESIAVGPVVIGRAARGPGMRPVKVQSYADFVELFGEPSPGTSIGDVWRNGGSLAPTYGAYAAKAYLANNGPLTFVRLLGYENDNANPSVGLAGWKMSGSLTTASANGNGGAFGLFIAPTTSGSSTQFTINGTASLAAIFYVNNGTIGLVGDSLAANAGTEDIKGSGSVWVRSITPGSRDFKISINNGSTTEMTSSAFSFIPTDSNYIRNVFNTNPSLVNSRTIATGSKSYFLGPTFETTLDETVTGSYYAGVILALETNNKKATIWQIGQ